MAGSYGLFVWTPTGYELHEREGEPPSGGTEIQENGTRLAALAPPVTRTLCACGQVHPRPSATAVSAATRPRTSAAASPLA